MFEEDLPWPERDVSDIIKMYEKGVKPKFTKAVPKAWQDMTFRCMSLDASARPSFADILKEIK
jgi:hypothetical protein